MLPVKRRGKIWTFWTRPPSAIGEVRVALGAALIGVADAIRPAMVAASAIMTRRMRQSLFSACYPCPNNKPKHVGAQRNNPRRDQPWLIARRFVCRRGVNFNL